MEYQVTPKVEQDIERLLGEQRKFQPHERGFLVKVLSMRQSGQLEQRILHFEEESRSPLIDAQRRMVARHCLRVFYASQTLIKYAEQYRGKPPTYIAQLPAEVQEEILFFELALRATSREEQDQVRSQKLYDVGQCAFEYFTAIVTLRQQELQRQFHAKNRLFPEDGIALEKNRLFVTIAREEITIHQLEHDISVYEHAEGVDPEWRERIRECQDEIRECSDRIEQARVEYLALVVPEQREFADEMTRGFYSLQ